MLDERGRLLCAALGFVGLHTPPDHPALPALHRWLDSWRGVGQIAVGMHRQGSDLQLTEYGDGRWRATFYVTGMAHSIVGRSAWEPTAWGAVQQAAWQTLTEESSTVIRAIGRIVIAWLLCVLLLEGCTPHGRVGILPSLLEPEHAAEIVVIREWRFMGGGANFTVVLDGTPLYGLAVDEHVVLRVPPGEHIVTISRRGPFLNDAAATVRAEPHRRYYYRLETSTWSGDITLLPVAPSAGEQLVVKTRRVQ